MSTSERSRCTAFHRVQACASTPRWYHVHQPPVSLACETIIFILILEIQYWWQEFRCRIDSWATHLLWISYHDSAGQHTPRVRCRSEEIWKRMTWIASHGYTLINLHRKAWLAYGVSKQLCLFLAALQSNEHAMRPTAVPA